MQCMIDRLIDDFFRKAQHRADARRRRRTQVRHVINFVLMQ